MGRLRHHPRCLIMAILLGSWGLLANGFMVFGTGTAAGLTTAGHFPSRYPILGNANPNGVAEGGCIISPRRHALVFRSRNASPSTTARATRPVLAFLPKCVLWGKLRSSEAEAAAVCDSYADTIRNSKTGGAGDEFHSGGSGPPRSRGFGRWGWGGGGGDDSGGRYGGDDDWREGRDRLIALGATQGVMASRRSRYVSPYGVGRRRAASSNRQPGGMRQSNGYSGNRPFSATTFLTVLNVIVFMFQSRYPSITRAGWKLAPAIVQQGQWYRLITPMVLHGSLAHLLVNTMSFSSVGPLVERVLGSRKFLAVYLLSGIAGNVLSCVVNPRLPAVGASGAIFGMVGAWGAFCLMNESVMGKANSQRALRSVAQTVMINVAYGMSSSQIDNMGHLGGFLGGAAVTFLIGPRLRRMLNPYTGQVHTVDVSPKLSLPRFGRGSGERRL